MFDKFEILIIIIIVLLAFYFVISLGAGRSKNPNSSAKIARYLFGVRVLIGVIAIVSLILWLFL